MEAFALLDLKRDASALAKIAAGINVLAVVHAMQVVIVDA